MTTAPDDLRDEITATLRNTPTPGWERAFTAADGRRDFHEGPDPKVGHSYSSACALCVADVDALADALAPVVQAAIDKARREAWDEGFAIGDRSGNEDRDRALGYRIDNPLTDAQTCNPYASPPGPVGSEEEGRHAFVSVRRMVGRQITTDPRCGAMVPAALTGSRMCALPAEDPIHDGPTRLPSGALPTDGDAATVERHEFDAPGMGGRCTVRSGLGGALCLRPEVHPVHLTLPQAADAGNGEESRSASVRAAHVQGGGGGHGDHERAAPQGPIGGNAAERGRAGVPPVQPGSGDRVAPAEGRGVWAAGAGVPVGADGEVRRPDAEPGGEVGPTPRAPSPASAALAEFHRAFGLAYRAVPQCPVPEGALRVDLLREEVDEYAEAVAAGDLSGLAHELADVVYVAYGTALTYGFDLDAVVAEVHRANMSKLGADGKPVVRADGKVLKGPNYHAPAITLSPAAPPPGAAQDGEVDTAAMRAQYVALIAALDAATTALDTETRIAEVRGRRLAKMKADHRADEDVWVAERADLRPRLVAVRALHFVTASASGGTNCGGCSHDWPCPTTRILDRPSAHHPKDLK